MIARFSASLMWNPFKKSAKAHNTPASTPRPLAPSVPSERKHNTSLGEPSGVDCNFVSRLIGCKVLHDQALAPNETKLLLSIRNWAHSAQAIVALPRLPATLPKLMKLLRREELSVPELAEHLSSDPALLGETMRIANSPFYRSACPVASVADALQMIGQTGLSQLVTRVAIGPVFGAQQGRFSKSATGTLWEHAQRCAHACGWLSRGEGDAFDAYLVGMVAGTGFVVVLRMLDREMHDQQTPCAKDFYSAVHDCGVLLSAKVAQQWGLPQQVVQALLTRVPQAHVAASTPLAMAVQRADRCAKLVLLHRSQALYEASNADDLACVQEILRSFPDAPSTAG